MAFKRPRVYMNQDVHHSLENELHRKDNIIRDLQYRLEVVERKKQHIQRAYYTMARDTRAESTKLRLFLEKLEDEEEGEEIFHEDLVQTMKKMTKDIILLGHCPLSQEPLGNNTVINMCGHIFDKNALSTHKPKLCPKCSQKIMGINLETKPNNIVSKK